jgi:hypothetical protein
MSSTPPPVSQTVTTTADSGAGSLRAVLASAPTSGYITFASNLTGATIALASPLTISDSVTILGPCPNVTITGSGAGPMLSVTGGALVALNNLTLTSSGGTALAASSGALVLGTGLVVTGSSAPSCPAVTLAAGSTTLTLTTSTIAGNTSSGDGIICQSGGTLTLDRVALTNNTTSAAGTLDVTSGKTIVLDSEFDNGKSGNSGGAITQSGGTLQITNATFYKNASSKGAGLFIDTAASAVLDNVTAIANTPPQIFIAGTAQFHNTLVANANGVDVTGTVASAGYNFISNSSTSSGWVASDILNQTLATYNFGYYGGPTDTIPPVSGAMVVNGGDPANGTCPDTDQRLLKRPIGPRCDIGAVEFNFASPP